MAEGGYLQLIQVGVDDIIRRLNRVVRTHAASIDQVIITGEGAAFLPVTDQIRGALAEVNLPEGVVLSHSAVTCSEGAAGWSFAVWNSMKEAQ